MALLKFAKYNRQIAYAPPSKFTLTVDKNGYIGDKHPADSYTHYCFKEVTSDYSESGLGQVTLLKTAVIGDKEYVTGIMPDGKEWMCQNLDYVSAKDGIVVGTNCWYYSNNETTYGWNGKKYGLLYTWDAAMAINIDGWHVPSTTEWDTLATAIGSNAGTKLKSTYDWSSNGNGTDNYGFNGVPSGYCYSAVLSGLGSDARFWTSTEINSNTAYALLMNTSVSINLDENNKIRDYSLRLVKDT